MVVLPELCAMLPDEPGHAKGRAPIAAKKVCKPVCPDASLIVCNRDANWCEPCKASGRLPPARRGIRGKHLP